MVQVYVALSRSKSLQGKNILGELDSKHVGADPRVHHEYKMLREISLVDVVESHYNAPILSNLNQNCVNCLSSKY